MSNITDIGYIEDIWTDISDIFIPDYESSYIIMTYDIYSYIVGQQNYREEKLTSSLQMDFNHFYMIVIFVHCLVGKV